MRTAFNPYDVRAYGSKPKSDVAWGWDSAPGMGGGAPFGGGPNPYLNTMGPNGNGYSGAQPASMGAYGGGGGFGGGQNRLGGGPNPYLDRSMFRQDGGGAGGTMTGPSTAYDMGGNAWPGNGNYGTSGVMGPDSGSTYNNSTPATLGGSTGPTSAGTGPYSDQDIQQWINTLGYGNFQFNGDFNRAGGVTDDLLLRILGGQQATGVSDADLARATGGSLQDITNARGLFTQPGLDYSDSIAASGRGFVNDYGVGDLDNVQDRYLTTRNSDGTYTTTERSGNQYGDDGDDSRIEKLMDQTGMSLQELRQSGMWGHVRKPTGLPGMTPPGTPPPGGGTTGGAGGSATGAPSLNTQYTPNPYLTDQIKLVGDQISKQFGEQILPGIRSSAIGSGVYGSAKSNLAEGRAAGDAAKAFTDASSNMLFGDYTNWSNRNLQKYGMDQSYSLGNKGLDNNFYLGNKGLDVQKYGIDTGADTQRYGIDSQYKLGQGQLGLGYYQAGNNFYLGNQGQQQQFYTAQRGQDIQSLLAGMGLYSGGTQGQWSPYQMLSQIYGPYSGYGQSTNTNTGFDWSRALGNGLGIYQGLTG